MKTLKALKTELLADPATHAEYDAMADEFDMAREHASGKRPECPLAAHLSALCARAGVPGAGAD